MITYRNPPAFSNPINGPAGLYMEILCDTGAAKPVEALGFVRNDVIAAGYDPDGRGMFGPPCQHGIIACTHAMWFYEKVKK